MLFIMLYKVVLTFKSLFIVYYYFCQVKSIHKVKIKIKRQDGSPRKPIRLVNWTTWSLDEILKYDHSNESSTFLDTEILRASKRFFHSCNQKRKPKITKQNKKDTKDAR